MGFPPRLFGYCAVKNNPFHPDESHDHVDRLKFELQCGEQSKTTPKEGFFLTYTQALPLIAPKVKPFATYRLEIGTSIALA